MKTIAYATITTAILATAAVAGAHAQTAFETRNTSTTETLGNVTTNVQTQYVSSTTVMPSAIGDAPATPTETSDGSVKVKLPSGEIISVADSATASWNKDPKLAGYTRFTFDADSGAFVASSGDDKYATNWDENGNRVKKVAPAPKKKKVVKKAAAVEETTTTEEAPATEAPATDAPAGETPAEEAPATDAPATH